MGRKNRIYALILLMAAITALSCKGGDFDGDILSGNRNLIIDVDNRLFSPSDAAGFWEQGPEADKLVLTVSLDGGQGNIEEIMLPGHVDNNWDYTQLTVPVSGTLSRMDATAYKGDSQLYTVHISEKPSYEIFEGWETFANVTRFTVDLHVNTDDWSEGFLSLDISPRGYNSVSLQSDSGVTALADMVTDWSGPPLTSRQIAIEPVLNENPAGLTFDLYCLVVDEDIKEIYKPDYLNDQANYEYYPWQDDWSFEEITETGKRVGDELYILSKYNTGDSLPFIEPYEAGYNSYLIDLSAETEDPLGKYLLVALILKYGVLSVPASVEVIGIR